MASILSRPQCVKQKSTITKAPQSKNSVKTSWNIQLFVDDEDFQMAKHLTMQDLYEIMPDF